MSHDSDDNDHNCSSHGDHDDTLGDTPMGAWPIAFKVQDPRVIAAYRTGLAFQHMAEFAHKAAHLAMHAAGDCAGHRYPMLKANGILGHGFAQRNVPGSPTRLPHGFDPGEVYLFAVDRVDDHGNPVPMDEPRPPDRELFPEPDGPAISADTDDLMLSTLSGAIKSVAHNLGLAIEDVNLVLARAREVDATLKGMLAASEREPERQRHPGYL